jgi:hypothetical protein
MPFLISPAYTLPPALRLGCHRLARVLEARWSDLGFGIPMSEITVPDRSSVTSLQSAGSFNR